MASKSHDLAAADRVEPEIAALEDDFLQLLHDVARQTSSLVNAESQTLGVTQLQLIILTRLERQPDVSQTELADATHVTPMTIARLVDRLEALGLVERRADAKDRRLWRLRLTAAAAPILRQMKCFQPTLHRALTKSIDPSVLKAMALGLRQMKQNVSNCRSMEASSNL